MEGNLFNPDGHFEDLDVVQVHDDLLAQHGTSWQCTQALNSNDKTIEQAIQSYVNHRIAENRPYWGVKDPRLSLFLPYWHRALETVQDSVSA